MNCTSSCRSQQNHDFLQAAVEFADCYGWCCIPMRGKVPVGLWKAFQTRRPTSAELSERFGRPGVTGLAVLGGDISEKLADRDFDVMGSYQSWRTSHPKLAKALPTTKTHRGAHVLFIGPVHFDGNLGDGEYRGNSKHYSVLPPSRHPKGSIYEWIVKPGKKIPVIDDPFTVGLLPYRISDKSANSGILVSDGDGTNENLLPNNTNRGQTAPDRGSRLPEPTRRRNGNFQGWMIPDRFKLLAVNYEPTKVGERDERILAYVRAVKRMGERLGIEWDTFRARVTFDLWWYGSSRDVGACFIVGTKDRSVSLRTFFDAWGNCPELPSGLDVDRLRDSAKGVELSLMADHLSEREKLLLQGCVVLQQWNGDGQFFLSQDDAGRLIGKSERTARRSLYALCDGGLLERTATGSNLTGKASFYRCTFLP